MSVPKPPKGVEVAVVVAGVDRNRTSRQDALVHGALHFGSLRQRPRELLRRL